MTEEEAKSKWCPFARVKLYTVSAEPAANRKPNGELPRQTLCVASTCMAWRWTPNVDMRAYTGTAAKARPGYCGLAGVPA